MTPMDIAPAPAPATNGCGCGCGCDDCKGACCGLECLLRPNFYCNQLVTDRDFSALVEWVQAKIALRRFRGDWGVVCGLEVTCGRDDKGHSAVSVAPGYAIDCCGRDLVVCKPLLYSFTCDRLDDPCCRGGRTTQPPPEQKFRAKNMQLPASQSDFELACMPGDELRVYDLCLRYDETMTGGQRPLVRGNCAPRGDCNYSRVLEGASLVAVEAPAPSTMFVLQNDDVIYRKHVRALIAELEEIGTAKDLLKWVRGKLHTFCFVEHCLCEIRDEDPKKQNLGLLKYLIVQDFRNHYFQHVCTSCDENACDGDGVPIARVWVHDADEDGCRICKVAYIDSQPPHRRPVGCGCAEPNHHTIDLGPHIWMPPDDVAYKLKQVGVTVTQQPFTPDQPGLQIFQTLISDRIRLAMPVEGETRIGAWTMEFGQREHVVAFGTLDK